MASSINAATAGAGGVITTADNSGILNLQSGGNTVATVQASGFSLPSSSTINAANTFGFKNRIINGGMTIDQRNAGASVTPVTGQYLVDRFKAGLTQASKFTAQQNAGSVTPPTGFTNYLGCTSSSAYSVTSSDIFLLQQPIEGYNTADLGWGTANAKTVTLSAWVYSSLTGTFGGALSNNTRSYPFSYTISSANTWTQISVTIAGDTSGTWSTTTGGSISVRFGLGGGSTYSGTAGAWTTADLYTATGATSVVGTNGATFYITGVQLEVGSQATSFDFRSYTNEFAMCQRYYIQNFYQQTAQAWSTNNGIGTITFPVAMRTSPTYGLTSGSTTAIDIIGSSQNCSTSLNAATVNRLGIVIGSGLSVTANQPLVFNSTNQYASAEL
jgi:hypothetical protein